MVNTDVYYRACCYINGDWQPAADGGKIKVVEPFTGAELGECAAATAKDVDVAVQCAAVASKTWGKTTGKERSVYLLKFAEAVKARKDMLSLMETKDSGKPLPESEWDMDDVAACFEYYAKLAISLDEKQKTVVDVGDSEYQAYLRYEPVGVAACIVPWNYPLLMATWKVAPALAAGCTVVLKPSELTPFTATVLGDIATEIGLPQGVLNIVVGYGPVAGDALVRHPQVRKVAFTGSIPTGMSVMKGCVDDVKNVTLELGGKSPAIVLDDCALNTALEWVMFGCFWTNGQICSATSRLLIHENIADKFIQLLKENVARIKMGDPMDQDCRLGPLVSKAQQMKVLGMIDQAIEEGAELVCGGKGKTGAGDGFFVEPTVLKTKPDMTIWKTEVFGPVLSVMTFKTDEEAIALANDSKYGLASAVFSENPKRLEAIIPQLEAGIVWTNCSQPCFPQLPWGGVKQSSVGGRDLGEFGLHNFMEPKQVVQRVVAEPLGWYDMKSQL